MVVFPDDASEIVLLFGIFSEEGKYIFSEQLGEIDKAGQRQSSFTPSLCSVMDITRQLLVEHQALCLAEGLVCGLCNCVHKALTFVSEILHSMVENLFFSFFVGHSYLFNAGYSGHHDYPRGNKASTGVLGSFS